MLRRKRSIREMIDHALIDRSNYDATPLASLQPKLPPPKPRQYVRGASLKSKR